MQKEKEKIALSKDLEEFKTEEERAALELWQVFFEKFISIYLFLFRKIKNIRRKSMNKKKKKLLKRFPSSNKFKWKERKKNSENVSIKRKSLLKSTKAKSCWKN